jgi:hypothetical protein
MNWALLGIILLLLFVGILLLLFVGISLLLLVGISLLLLVGILLLLRLIAAVKELGTESPQPPAIPDQIAGSAIANFLKIRLAGTPADGSTYVGNPPTSVVWVNNGDEVLVHLTSITTQVVGQNILVSIDLETDQTGRTPLVVVFALGTDDKAGLVVATDEFPRGNEMLATRWGAAVQTAAWSAMLSLANDHASERGLTPRGLAANNGQLQLIAGQTLKIA